MSKVHAAIYRKYCNHITYDDFKSVAMSTLWKVMRAWKSSETLKKPGMSFKNYFGLWLNTDTHFECLKGRRVSVSFRINKLFNKLKDQLISLPFDDTTHTKLGITKKDLHVLYIMLYNQEDADLDVDSDERLAVTQDDLIEYEKLWENIFSLPRDVRTVIEEKLGLRQTPRDFSQIAKRMNKTEQEVIALYVKGIRRLSNNGY